MDYFTERNGMRKITKQTYEIDIYAYRVLLKICERYYDNIAWKYPMECPDGGECYGLDKTALAEEMHYEIPSLFTDYFGKIGAPQKVELPFFDESQIDDYDQYALLDFIEFMYDNIRDVEKGDYHQYFSHYHLRTGKTANIRKQYRDDINAFFSKAGLLYKLETNGNVERIIIDDVASEEIVDIVLSVEEKGIHDLLQEAIELHRSHYPNAPRDSAEKLWDAFERLKTYYSDLKKKESVNKIISTAANGNDEFENVLQAEFKALTDIGNHYSIRHHETNIIEIQDSRHYDYLFNRCMSVIALAIKCL